MLLALKRLFILSIFWILTWGVIGLVLKPLGYNYVADTSVFCLYYALAIAALYLFCGSELKKKINNFRARDIWLIVFVYVISFALILITRYLVGENALSHVDLRMDELFWLSPRYFITKSFEILFQQAFFVVSLGYLLKSPLSTNKEILLFGVFVLVLHIPLFLFLSFYYALFIALCALLSGIVFAYAITHLKDGFVYSFVLHLFFYAFISSLYWLY